MDDSDLLKYIVEELAKEPFKLDYNLASFGSLKGKALLNVFQTILEDINPKHNEDLGDDNSRPKKILELLRVLRYWPKYNDSEYILEGLEGPIPEVIWEIMHWLLSRREELKQRAYLGLYLVKIPVPDEIMLDEDVELCYQQYESQIEEFKNTHKKLQEITREAETRQVSELVTDLGKINHDIECLGRKVEALKNRIGDFPEKEEYLEKAKIIRKARDEKLRLEDQMREEESKLIQITRKAEVSFGRFKDLQDMTQHNTPEGVLERVEQDFEVLKYIVGKRLPSKIQEIQRSVLALTITEEQPPECLADLEYSRLKLDEVCRDINYYENQRRCKELDPSMNFARQQSLNNHKKKIDLSGEMEIMKDDLVNIRHTIEDKRKQKRMLFGLKEDAPLTTEGYRDYMKVMRIKAAKYKSMRRELQSLQAEVGHLSTTKYILQGELKSSEETLEVVEEQLGIVGFSSSNIQERLEKLSSEKSSVEQKKMNSIYEMAIFAKTLNERVEERKSELEPLIKKLQTERQVIQDLENEMRQAKDTMEMEITPINDKIARLQKHFDQLVHSCEKDELHFAQLSSEVPVMKENLTRAQYITEIWEQNTPLPRIRTFREKLLAKIMESEQIQQSLNTELVNLDDTQEYENSQQKMWMELYETLKLKLDLLREPQVFDRFPDDADNSI